MEKGPDFKLSTIFGVWKLLSAMLYKLQLQVGYFPRFTDHSNGRYRPSGMFSLFSTKCNQKQKSQEKKVTLGLQNLAF